MTPTTDELRALVERLESDKTHDPDIGEIIRATENTENEALAAAALRLWIAERERITDTMDVILADQSKVPVLKPAKTTLRPVKRGKL